MQRHGEADEGDPSAATMGFQVCAACGLNLDQAPENILGPIEIDVEPEQTAAQTLSPELMRMFRGNQLMYIFRMLLLIVIALFLLLSNWLNSMNNTADFISMSLATVAPGLLVGLWGLFGSLARLRKSPSELAAQVSASPHGAFSLFSVHERIVLKAPVLGILLSAGALYAAFLILQNTLLTHIAHNLSMLGRLGGRNWWDALDKAGAGVACSAMLLFCISYPIRTIRLFMLKGKVTQSM